ncbi:hypothetical protein IWW38_004427, partial [Coemansia aciculifera]
MATGSDYHKHDAVDTKHPAQPVASPRSELVNTFIAYYSSADCAPVPAEAYPLHDLLSSSSTPTSTSSSSTAASDMHMRSDKKTVGQSSGQSTDSEYTGNGSSGSSSSSLGDSATAAARVLAAWQDRALPTGPIASGATVSAGISADDSAIWTAARVHSSTSTPRHAASSFDPHTREGSAPVPGSLEAAANRRTDMGFLALLNSAAAFVAESSVSPQKQQQQQQQTQQTQQHHTVDNPYLTLSSINNGYGQAAVDAAVAAEQGDY